LNKVAPKVCFLTCLPQAGFLQSPKKRLSTVGRKQKGSPVQTPPSHHAQAGLPQTVEHEQNACRKMLPNLRLETADRLAVSSLCDACLFLPKRHQQR